MAVQHLKIRVLALAYLKDMLVLRARVRIHMDRLAILDPIQSTISWTTAVTLATPVLRLGKALECSICGRSIGWDCDEKFY